MKYHIGYWGGAGGDFLRGLIVSGLKDIKTKWHDWRLWVKFDNGTWKHVVHVTGSGKVDVVGPMDIDNDRYRGIQLGHEIGKPINQVKKYLLKCQKEGIGFQKFLIDFAVETGHGVPNGWNSETSVSVGHDHINFVHTFGSFKEWHEHIFDRRKTNKIIYITINTLAEANQRWVNNSHKNDPNDRRRLPDKERGLHHLGEHQEIHNIILKEKRTNDIIFPFKYLYNKEYLREWLRNEFDWNDRCYDALYDAWYIKQDVIL
tara:strand:- start:595 stop:1374 length:780 start_codon:yes stop_codon:yes gene_type:complete